MCNFQVGQKVVCVNAGVSGLTWLGDPPVEGKIYTIRSMRSPATATLVNGVQVVLLYFHEIRRQALSGIGELGYFHLRFRALEERKRQTDIEIFRKILDEGRKTAKEPV